MFDRIFTGFTRKVMMILFDELFVVSVISYLFIYLFDQMSHGFIGDFFNVDILLAIVIISGILVTVPEAHTRRAFHRIGIAHFTPIIIIAIFFFFFIYWKIQDSGSFAFLISMVLTLTLVGLSWLLFTYNDTA